VISHAPGHAKQSRDTADRRSVCVLLVSWIERAPGGVFPTNGEKYWLDKRRAPAYAAWAGYTFENICLTHVQWIQKALRLDHISFEVGSWCFVPAVGHADRSGTQIDLLFDRDDPVISLCEIKYNAAQTQHLVGGSRRCFAERGGNLRILALNAVAQWQAVVLLRDAQLAPG